MHKWKDYIAEEYVEMGGLVWPLLENMISHKDEAFSKQESDNIFLGQSKGKDKTN